jgi:hypothetical protein
MKVISKDRTVLNVQKVKMYTSGIITVDGVSASPPLTIETQTHIGFFALENLKPMFEHMKCWRERNGEECGVCPVHHDGVCGIMGIKDAAEKEALEKGSIVI